MSGEWAKSSTGICSLANTDLPSLLHKEVLVLAPIYE